MKEDLPKAYDPSLVEKKWYQFWEKNNLFSANASSSKKPFTIVIPPPNVTGVLHMGHALDSTLYDIVIRWKRMLGYEALLVPGTDHAGIATQTVVERHLIKTTGKRRTQFSREEFLSHVWKWKEESQQQILSQLRRVGSSCDWSRLCFTLDEPRNLAVKTVFKKMFDDGLIYRGYYLVNWDPVTQTALADDEVEYEERSSSLWFFRYPLADNSGHVTIATTRPETMLGDTALAVSPKDPRYQHLIGKEVLLPFTKRSIPILADNFVDPEFGTGIVKITPAHDTNDYQVALRHNLEMINIMTPDGRINDAGGSFAGLSMEEARESIVSQMQSLGLVERVIPHLLRVGRSYRSKAVIEPYLSKQWFVKCSAFKKQLRAVVEEKKVQIIPAAWEHHYYHWIDNLRDWCISRQLWWGHRIPIWYHRDDPERMICYAGEGLPPEVEKEPSLWHQDEDVLDTWFSSALWPFAVFGWPNTTPEFEKFYPTSLLVTGHDILFFWVARMILMAEYVHHEPPFSQVFLHGLIYGKSYWRHATDGSIAYVSAAERADFDSGKAVPKEVSSKWEKMSKSKGNIIDPLEIIDSFGADAMRMALASSPTQSPQIDLDRRKFEEFKNFANKVWNGARFVIMNLSDISSESLQQGIHRDLLRLEDRWILSLLNRTIQQVNQALNDYSFDRASMTAYDFFWKDFCAYYVEISKPILFGKQGSAEEKSNKQKILLITLTAVLRLLHPMAPFITEELFQILKGSFGSLTPSSSADHYTKECLQALHATACMVAPYPQPLSLSDINPEVEKQFAFLDETLRVIRNIRAEMALPPSLATDLYLLGDQKSPEMLLCTQNQELLASLVPIQNFYYEQKSIPFSASSFAGPLKLIIPLPEQMRDKERLRLEKEKEKIIAKQNSLRTQLANPDFVEKAPPAITQKLKEQLGQQEIELADIMEKLAQF